MKKITFKYADAMSDWKWKTQSCIVSSLDECKRIYGLYDDDVMYEIIKIEEIKNDK